VSTTFYLVDRLDLSGKVKGLIDLVSHLDPARYRAIVCTLSEGDGILAARLRSAGAQVLSVPGRDGLNFGIVLRLVHLLYQYRPDVVHCYNPRPIVYGGLAARLLRIRGVIGSLSAFACQVPDRSYPFRPQRFHTESRRDIYRNRLASHLMRYLVAVSPALGERFFRFNRLPAGKLRVIPYGTDLDAFWRYTTDDTVALRRQMGFGPHDIVIGSVGRLVEEKDYPTQLRAFALAAREVPQLRMVLAGNGRLRPSLEQLTHALGVQDRVRFFGLCENVPLFTRSLDLFVLASKFEAFGLALVEAKAAGLPIVATEINEIPEILSHGRSGLLVPLGNPEKFAAAFVRLARNPDLRRALAQQALQEAREGHSLQVVVRRYQELYDEVRGVGDATVG
jgi:glycosyltransferase involved in cell wall biosynthesis